MASLGRSFRQVGASAAIVRARVPFCSTVAACTLRSIGMWVVSVSTKCQGCAWLSVKIPIRVLVLNVVTLMQPEFQNKRPFLCPPAQIAQFAPTRCANWLPGEFCTPWKESAAARATLLGVWFCEWVLLAEHCDFDWPIVKSNWESWNCGDSPRISASHCCR